MNNEPTDTDTDTDTTDASFSFWLAAQTGRNDSTGLLARDVMAKRNQGCVLKTIADLLLRLTDASGAKSATLAALEEFRRQKALSAQLLATWGSLVEVLPRCGDCDSLAVRSSGGAFYCDRHGVGDATTDELSHAPLVRVMSILLDSHEGEHLASEVQQ